MSNQSGADKGRADDIIDQTQLDTDTYSSHGEANHKKPPRKKKRARTEFSNYQLDLLEDAFRVSQHPDIPTRQALAQQLMIREDRIKVVL